MAGATIVRQAVTYVVARVSRHTHDISLDQINARLATCERCEHIERDADAAYCGKCGCGHKRRAALATKASMPLATCPLGRWARLDAAPPA